MYEPNVTRLLASLSPDDVVRDVGGWACPFNRAQWVLDAQPFETRYRWGLMGARGVQWLWWTDRFHTVDAVWRHVTAEPRCAGSRVSRHLAGRSASS